MKDEDKKQFHFFVSSGLHWNTGEDLYEVLQRQKRMDRARGTTFKCDGCNVFKVPLPNDAKYQIDNYQPQVEGVEFIDSVQWVKPK